MTEQRKKPLTPRQIKIIQGKVAGNTQRDIGLKVFPNATPESASVLVTRELKKVNMQDALAEALERNGITIDRALRPIDEGLDATKVVIHGNKEEAFAEVEPDHATRLKAAGMALNLMIPKGSGDININFNNMAQTERNEYELT